MGGRQGRKELRLMRCQEGTEFIGREASKVKLESWKFSQLFQFLTNKSIPHHRESHRTELMEDSCQAGI